MNLKVSERKVTIKKQNLEILKVFNFKTGINFSENNITFYTATTRNTKNIYFFFSFFFSQENEFKNVKYHCQKKRGYY